MLGPRHEVDGCCDLSQFSTQECVVKDPSIYIIEVYISQPTTKQTQPSSFQQFKQTNMIHQYSKLFLSLLTLPTFLDAAFGSYIRTHKSDSSQNVEGQMIVVPDLGKLGKYVCPSVTNLVNRQVSSGEITVSTNDLRSILVELRLAEVKLLELLRNPNSIPPPVRSVIAPAPSQLVLAVSSAPYSTVNDLTTTFTYTSTIISTTTEWVITVTETVIETIYPYPASGSMENVAAPSTTLVAVSDTMPLPPTISSEALQIGFTTAYFAPLATSVAVEVSVSTAPPAQPIINNPSTLNQVATNQAGKGNYQFNPRSNSNIAVYYGQSPATASTSLVSQCADPNSKLSFSFSPVSNSTLKRLLNGFTHLSLPFQTESIP